MEASDAGIKQCSESPLALFLANSRSIKGKTAEVQFITSEYDIVCLVETHIDDTINNCDILSSQSKTIFRWDRNIHGGGVLIAAANSLQPTKVELDTLGEEMVVVQIKHNIIICCYYRPNISMLNMAALRNVVEHITNKYHHHSIILVGDFNLPEIDWETRKLKYGAKFKSVHLDFLTMLFENRMQQLVTQPTHIHGNILDLICTNNTALVTDIDIISPGLSDHYIITAVLTCHRPNLLKTQPKTIRLYKNANITGFRDSMQTVCNKLEDMSDPDNMWPLFREGLAQACKDHIPTKVLKPRNSRWPVWFDKEAKKLAQKQRKTWFKYKKTRDVFFLEKYKTERKSCKKLLCHKKRNYVVEKVCKPLERGNSKPFFKHLRQKTGQDNFSMSLTDPDTNQLTDNSLRCAEILNSYFYSQFCQDHQVSQYPNSSDTHNICISIKGLESLIRGLANGKSPGPDGIRKPDLLVDTEINATCLQHIYHASLKSGKLPREWKLANVTPIHKGGSKESPQNYRPISLTSIPCKMLEHIILHYLNATLDNILHNRQHGFRKGMSCDTQLCSTYHDIAKAHDQSQDTHAIVLDFKKAFDKVPHSLLLLKLRRIPEVNQQIINWIQDFITNRKQRVVIKGSCSTELPVTSGVPQGSVLGPTLFLVYINDLPSCVNCCVSLYADDTLLYQRVNSEADAADFQVNIDAVYNWSQQWKMPFNESKCHAISFGCQTGLPSYKLGSTPVQWTEETKYLGVTMQSNLKFDKHIVLKSQKASRVLGAIKFALHDAPKNGKLLAYTSLCRPLLEYADTLWDPYLKTTIHDIEMVQNRAVRFISGLKGRESVSDARCELGLLPLQARRKNHRLTLLTRILQSEATHSTLSSDYDEVVENRSLMSVTTRSATQGLPNSISSRSSCYHQSFLPRTIRDMRGFT